MWGNDLSSPFQGAGGVGGLLAISYRATATTNAFVAYDGNGNVSALMNAADGALVAKYEYDPFGNLLRASGPMAKVNPFRFSTKYQDNQCDLLYYGYRYYNPSSSLWLSRDPIEEEGGLNLYGFVGNDSIDYLDAQGFGKVKIAKAAYKRIRKMLKNRKLSALFHVHHIIGQEVFANPKFGPWLKSLGFEKDEVRNLLILPNKKGKELLVRYESKYSKRTIHEGRSGLQEYIKPIMDRLDEIQTLPVPDCEKRGLIVELQNELADKLKDGTININAAEVEQLSNGAISLCGLAIVDVKLASDTDSGKPLDDIELAVCVTTYTGTDGVAGFVGKTIEFFNPVSDGAQLANDFVSAAIRYLLIPLGELGGRGGNAPFGGGRW